MTLKIRIEYVMTINEEYAIEMLLGGHYHGMEIRKEYPTAFMYEAKITNPERLDRWLLNNGYLRKPTAAETISQYKVTELKEVLDKLGLKKTGKKADLVERILSNVPKNQIAAEMSRDKRYFLSEKGLKHYRENIDLEKLHRNWKYGISLEKYFEYRKVNGVVRDFYETAYLAMQEKIKNGVFAKYGYEIQKRRIKLWKKEHAQNAEAQTSHTSGSKPRVLALAQTKS